MKCDHVCKECGSKERGSWSDRDATRLRDEGLCFTCDHFLKLPECPDYQRFAVIVDGTHYMIGEDKGPDRWKGFGGQWWKIRFHDGREVETTDLWCQGTIPAHLRDRLSDNATFVREATP